MQTPLVSKANPCPGQTVIPFLEGSELRFIPLCGQIFPDFNLQPIKAFCSEFHFL
jgi:hypothetical protein